VTRSELVRSLTAAEGAQLLEWFVESYDEGWRPTMPSHVAGKVGRYTPFGVDALRAKAGELVKRLAELDQQ